MNFAQFFYHSGSNGAAYAASTHAVQYRTERAGVALSQLLVREHNGERKSH